MLDSFIIFALSTLVIQIGYGAVVGRDPFNSLLAGSFCSLGMFALCGKPTLSPNTVASFRVQLSDAEFKDYSNKAALAEFIGGSLLLFLACLCLIG